ncbi:NADP-dependent glyceraldehyde-3-phosphate dehydrogenase [Prevotella sp. MGM1]|nr:NADP-dependent glyceraldehyde-3-phosphate dehydrogenase [Prevotella sp. MGM1]
MQANGYLNATRLAANHTPTGIPLRKIGATIILKQGTYRIAYSGVYRLRFLFQQKTMCQIHDFIRTKTGYARFPDMFGKRA